MYADKIKYLLLEIPDVKYGIQQKDSKIFMGMKPIEIKDNSLLVENESFLLTDGLVNLLATNRPVKYSVNDLEQYRKILLLTSAHKLHFCATEKIKATAGWKYKNIISKLFPPKRSYASRTQDRDTQKDSEDLSEQDILLKYDNVNELVEKMKYLETEGCVKNNNKIMIILRELERLGIITFYK